MPAPLSPGGTQITFPPPDNFKGGHPCSRSASSKNPCRALLTRGNGTVSANSDPIYFGGGVANYDSFLGLIDEVRIYTNTLPAEDISLAGAWATSVITPKPGED